MLLKVLGFFGFGGGYWLVFICLEFLWLVCLFSVCFVGFCVCVCGCFFFVLPLVLFVWGIFSCGVLFCFLVFFPQHDLEVFKKFLMF